MIYTQKISAKYTYLHYVKVEDAEFILSLRTDPKNSRYINDTENDLDIQIEWIQQQQSKPNDYYFVICDLNNNPKGVISLYNFDQDGKNAEMGRLICPKSPIQLYEALILIFCFGFETLGLKRMFYRMNPNNAEIIAITHKFGAEFVGYGNYESSNIQYVEYQNIQETWPLLKARNNARLETFVKAINRQENKNSSLLEV
jgi:RimJ/RimL family protein N-acetyltransferase